MQMTICRVLFVVVFFFISTLQVWTQLHLYGACLTSLCQRFGHACQAGKKRGPVKNNTIFLQHDKKIVHVWWFSQHIVPSCLDFCSDTPGSSYCSCFHLTGPSAVSKWIRLDRVDWSLDLAAPQPHLSYIWSNSWGGQTAETGTHLHQDHRL